MALSSSLCVRRYLSEPGEKEALRVLKEQLRYQKRITSDDVRLAVRAVASQGGAVAIPLDFPPSRWVLEFKRVHGFMQLNSFAFNTMVASIGDNAAWTPERLEMAKLRPASATVEPGSNRERPTSASNNSSSSSSSSIQEERRNSSSTGVVQVTGSNDNTNDDGKEERPSKESDRSLLPMLSKAAVAYADSRPSSTNETQRQTQLQHNFSQRHQQQLQQQQRRAKIVDERRRAVVWPSESARGPEETRPGTSRGSRSNKNNTNTGRRDARISGSGSDVGPNGRRDLSSMLPQIQQVVTNNGGSMDDIQDSASNTSSSSKDKRNYKLSHTVPPETWDKAIAAVEQQGMSLRTAAKMYGVHFAALHRRVKKRTQGGQANGNDVYFDPNDEAGIMRVVVAHAELGVLMTFDELIRLVEAVALRKLPDISVDLARKLLTRFESRNAQSIRHIIDDWPPPQPSMDANSSAKPYLEHPGFSYGPTSTTNTGGAATAAAVAAATPTTLFVPPIRLAPNIVDFRNDSKSPAVRLIDTMRTMDIETTPSLSPSNHVGCIVTHPRLHPSREVCIEEGVDLRK